MLFRSIAACEANKSKNCIAPDDSPTALFRRVLADVSEDAPEEEITLSRLADT